MAGANGIEPSCLHQLGLTFLGTVKGSCAEYSIVVVQTTTIELDGPTIEEESLL